MKFIFTTLKKTLFWSYERGSWQYDLMCVLILAFIFFVPNRFFDTNRHAAFNEPATRAIVVTSEELGSFTPGTLQKAIESHLSQRFGHHITVSPRIDRMTDEAGKVIYLVHEQ